MIFLEKEGIQYQVLDKDHLEETIDVVTQHFIKEEYLTRESKLTYSEFGKFVRAYCELDLSQKLSLIALDKNTKKVIGFSISEDPQLPEAVNPNDYLSLSPNFEPFFAVLNELHHQCLKTEFKQGECYHLFLLGVLPEYQGKKIGKTLLKLSGEYAKSKDFKYVLVEATSPITKPLCEKLEYKNLGNITYKDFVLNNKKPFSHLVDYDGPYMFIKHL